MCAATRGTLSNDSISEHVSRFVEEDRFLKLFFVDSEEVDMVANLLKMSMSNSIEMVADWMRAKAAGSYLVHCGVVKRA